MYDTIFLNPDTWDLEIDASGNVAMANAPYAVAQDAASACRLWKNEAPYNTERGIPYEQSILGMLPTPQLLSNWYATECETVPNISNCTPVLQFTRSSRSLSGQLQLTLTDGTTANVNI